MAETDVRDHAVLVATQTTLKPLLEIGVRPHFVTALDYHEISRRFYEGLTPDDVAGTTLVIEPKANPIIAASFPGNVICCRSEFLDMLLGPCAPDMADVGNGTTVAHLAYRVARWLGCDPVAFIGQDLGFTEGVYYSRGTAIDEVWAPELNVFNTIEMMEWQRIVRNKRHLCQVEDINGRSMYTDSQMSTYLKQFERMFESDRKQGMRVIDATEGGVRKAHCEISTLSETLQSFIDLESPQVLIPEFSSETDESRNASVAERLHVIVSNVRKLQTAAVKTVEILSQMRGSQCDETLMRQLFDELEYRRQEVHALSETLSYVNHLNQLGVFKRLKSDRRITLLGADAGESQLQLLEIERDIVNVEWIEDACIEFANQLEDAVKRLDGTSNPEVDMKISSSTSSQRPSDASDISVMIAVDPVYGGCGSARSLDSSLAGQTVLQRVLERFNATRCFQSIILVVPDNLDIESMIDLDGIDLNVEIDRSGETVFGPEQAAIRAARLWSDCSWRGGIAGMTVFDEIIAPVAMLKSMEQRSLEAVVVVGPDWPLVDVSSASGCQALVHRFDDCPQTPPVLFTQAPPGVCGVLVSRKAMGDLAGRTRQATLGAMLTYQPRCPQSDPIAKEFNIQIPRESRFGFTRAVFDSRRVRRDMRRAFEQHLLQKSDASVDLMQSCDVVQELQHQSQQNQPSYCPQQLIVEICTGRRSGGAASPHRDGPIERIPMTRKLFKRIVSQALESGDMALTLAGVGDPLLHPDFDYFIQCAKECGVVGVHLRTELAESNDVISRLLSSDVDVVSVDLYGASRETYKSVTGRDYFDQVISNIDYMVQNRRHVGPGDDLDALALPWIVPRMLRRDGTLDDVESFYDYWMHMLGVACIDGEEPARNNVHAGSSNLLGSGTPISVMYSKLLKRMTILSDGRVPVFEVDLNGDCCVGNAGNGSLLSLWREVLLNRRAYKRDFGIYGPQLRTWNP